MTSAPPTPPPVSLFSGQAIRVERRGHQLAIEPGKSGQLQLPRGTQTLYLPIATLVAVQHSLDGEIAFSGDFSSVDRGIEVTLAGVPKAEARQCVATLTDELKLPLTPNRVPLQELAEMQRVEYVEVVGPLEEQHFEMANFGASKLETDEQLMPGQYKVTGFVYPAGGGRPPVGGQMPVLRVTRIEMVDNEITRIFDHYRSLSKFIWVPRLLSAERIAELCPTRATSTMEPTWRHLPLALPVIHPGIFPNGARPLEELLSTDSNTVENVIYLQGEDSDPSVLVLDAGSSTLRLGQIISRDERERHAEHSIKAMSGPAAAYEILTQSAAPTAPAEKDSMHGTLEMFGKQPKDLFLTIAPVPPLDDSMDTELVSVWSTLFRKNRQAEMMLTLQPASILLESVALGLQHAFDAAWLATCEYLSAKIGTDDSSVGY